MCRKVILLLLVVAVSSLLLTIPVFAGEEPVLIYFFPGGNPGCSFATVVYNGAKAAEEILGDRVVVRYRWSDWHAQKMVTQFQEAVAANPDGIAIMGHPGCDAYEPFVEEAIAKGIIVTSQNTDLPELEERFRGEGFGYAGQNLYNSGHMLGRAAVEQGDFGAGDKAMVWGLLSAPTRGLRTKGVIDALEEAGMVVDYIEISSAVDSDASAGIPVITGYLMENPDCKLVVTDHGSLTSTQEAYFEAAGKEPGEIFGAGFDLSPAVVDAINSGYTHLVHDQQPFLQGFLPIMQIYLSKLYGFSGLHIDTGAGLVHAGNIEQIAPLAEQGLR